jgi:hypothetical protein
MHGVLQTGNTPLHYAQENDDAGVWALLKQHGAKR